MIKHKTRYIPIYDNSENPELELLTDRVVEEMLNEINDNGYIFLDLNITVMVYSKGYDYRPRIIITVVYREVEKREVLIEKTNND